MAASTRATLISRDLHVYEVINSVSSITLAVFVAGTVTASQLRTAIGQVYLIHPFLRMRIVPTKDARNGIRFMENADPEILLRTETGDVSGHSWQARLNAAACEPSRTELSVSSWRLVSSSDGKQHQVLWTVNHAGTDGIGIFSILDDLLSELGHISSGKPSPGRLSREFQDILSRVPPSALEYPAPQVPRNYMSAISAPDGTSPNDRARILGIWHEFDEQSTSLILDECKQHSCSFQGALNAAVIGAVCQAQSSKYNLPQDIVSLAPVNMRAYVNPPLDNKDSVCGSAGLTWMQNVDKETTLWEIAKTSSKAIAAALAEKQGLWWWASLSAGRPLPAPTLMCSSIGVTPLKRVYGALVLGGVKLLGGVYDKAKAGNAGIMTHAYTVNDRLNITFAYTSPPLSASWARRFIGTEVAVLEAMGRGAAGDEAIGRII